MLGCSVYLAETSTVVRGIGLMSVVKTITNNRIPVLKMQFFWRMWSY